MRTRRRLSEALLEMMLAEPFESITIQAIADRADLNRATFYKHYATKEELLIASLESRFDLLVQEIEAEMPNGNLFGSCKAEELVFQHVEKYADLYRVILGARGMGAVTNRIIQYIATVGKRDLIKTVPEGFEPKISVDILAMQYAGGLLSVLTWWVENEFPHPAEEMAKMLFEIGMFGCAPLLGIKEE